MAKYRHRVFEMYGLRDEALNALKPSVNGTPLKSDDCETWDLNLLAASHSANLTRVEFKQSRAAGEVDENDLRNDLARLSEKLEIDSKVLFDFTGLDSISPASVDTLTSFNKNLRHKGSRMVICCLETAVRESFFAVP
jgi:anti-anti-sigma regulatory factor